MDTDPSGSGGWRFAQCFGDKGEVEDITEGCTLLITPRARYQAFTDTVLDLQLISSRRWNSIQLETI